MHFPVFPLVTFQSSITPERGVLPKRRSIRREGSNTMKNDAPHLSRQQRDDQAGAGSGGGDASVFDGVVWKSFQRASLRAKGAARHRRGAVGCRGVDWSSRSGNLVHRRGNRGGEHRHPRDPRFPLAAKTDCHQHRRTLRHAGTVRGSRPRGMRNRRDWRESGRRVRSGSSPPSSE